MPATLTLTPDVAKRGSGVHGGKFESMIKERVADFCDENL